MSDDFTRPTEYVENVQCGVFDEGNTFGVRFVVGGKMSEGYLLEPDLVDLLLAELTEIREREAIHVTP